MPTAKKPVTATQGRQIARKMVETAAAAPVPKKPALVATTVTPEAQAVAEKLVAGLDAKAVMGVAGTMPTLNELMARDPKTLTPEDLGNIVERLRQERAAWQAKEDKAAAKKEAKAEEEGK